MSFKYFGPAERPEENLPEKDMFSKVISMHEKKGVSMLDANINDAIATLTLIARHDPNNVESNRNMENEILILAYLRDKHNATTANEALDLISDKKIDSNIIEFWIEEGMTKSPNITKAIKAGYPELLKKN
jgi:hypothetical protein